MYIRRAKNPYITNQLNHPKSIMKIAITFLCLVIASFIDPSTQNIHLQDLPKDKVDCVVRFAYEIVSKVEILRKCPESEKKARTKIVVEDVLSGMKLLAIDLGCTLTDLLTLILNNLDDIPDALNIEALLKSVLGLMEGVVAKAGIVLKTEFLRLNELSGSPNGVLSIVSVLHDTLGAVINGLTGTFLGTVLGFFPAVPGLLGSILGD
ncbi:uncharacterized protein [Engystomops pustulosus]|uniref:uncharacterized protein n=1 Tax=Engystomops pustulosus TaxID=76066 RepID=UPI003AFA8ADA